MVIALRQLITRHGETVVAQAVTPFPRHVILRRDAPGTIQRQFTMTLDKHADQPLLQHAQRKQMLIINAQIHACVMLPGKLPVF
ncbi:hypothetical protein D3C80_1920360 [compost metagenome]